MRAHVNTCMGFVEQFFFHPIAGSFGLLSIFGLNIWAVRIILAFQKETRDEYRARLRDAIVEIDQQKARNIRLELRLQTLEYREKQAKE